MMKREEKPHWRSTKQALDRSPRARQDGGGRGKGNETWMTIALKFSYFLPGLILGFTLGLWTELPKDARKTFFARPAATPGGARPSSKARKRNTAGESSSSSSAIVNSDGNGELKMVFVVRMDLRMGGGKVASQCAHAAVGIYSDLMRSNRSLLSKWESCGQPKIVVCCKNESEMDDLKAKGDRAGLPTFTIADAGRTQVAAGSKTVLVIGPGPKPLVDSVTRHLKLL